jgi:hypothetical protein
MRIDLMGYKYGPLVLLIISILFVASATPQVQKMTIIPKVIASTNMDELQRLESTRYTAPGFKGQVGPNIFPLQKPQENSLGRMSGISNILGVPSPAPSANFLAQADVPTVPQGFSWIPPDTWGAVGPAKLMSIHNNNVKIQTRAGVQLSLVSLATFWSPIVPVGTVFDPKVVYDQYNARWIAVSLSDPGLMTSALLVAISNTDDPSGAWTQYLYLMAANIQGNNCWADYPGIGFNKNWVAISVNMFTIAGGMFQETRILTINYPELLVMKLPFPTTTLFMGIADFTVQPCITYSATQEILYAPNSIWGMAAYRLNFINGTPSAPIYNMGGMMIHPFLGGWVGYIGDQLPQIPEPGTGSVAYIDGDDDRINNAVFRGEHIYYSQTVGLPSPSMTHTAAQWVVLDTAANYIQGGRIEDPQATKYNGKPWYAYPSINVNGYGDILVGFSQFSSAQTAASGYCYKDRTDLMGTMRDPMIFKAGQAFYWKTFGASRNRWGDYSFVQTDPSDNYNFWTIQEYAAPKVGVGDGSGRWGTWWAKVPPFSIKTPFNLGIVLRIQGFTDQLTGNMVADTVICMIRNGAPPYAMVDSTKVYLNMSGTGTAAFTNVLIGNDYYIVIKHRNAVQTWSHSVNFPIYNPTYSFTSAQNQAFASNQVLVGTNWCLYSGDVNQDGTVDLTDVIAVDNDNASFVTGYTNTDVNGDNTVDLTDVIIVDNNNATFVASVLPPGAPLASPIPVSKGITGFTSTIIHYKLPTDARVIIGLYQSTGQKVGEMIDENQTVGEYKVDLGLSPIYKSLQSGVYFYKISAIDKITGLRTVNAKKMMLVMK